MVSEQFVIEALFCPPCDGGGVGHVTEETEKDEGEDREKGMGITVFGSWIGHLFETGNEKFERLGSDGGWGYIDLHVCEK